MSNSIKRINWPWLRNRVRFQTRRNRQRIGIFAVASAFVLSGTFLVNGHLEHFESWWPTASAELWMLCGVTVASIWVLRPFAKFKLGASVLGSFCLVVLAALVHLQQWTTTDPAGFESVRATTKAIAGILVTGIGVVIGVAVTGFGGYVVVSGFGRHWQMRRELLQKGEQFDRMEATLKGRLLHTKRAHESSNRYYARYLWGLLLPMLADEDNGEIAERILKGERITPDAEALLFKLRSWALSERDKAPEIASVFDHLRLMVEERLLSPYISGLRSRVSADQRDQLLDAAHRLRAMMELQRREARRLKPVEPSDIERKLETELARYAN